MFSWAVSFADSRLREIELIVCRNSAEFIFANQLIELIDGGLIPTCLCLGIVFCLADDVAHKARYTFLQRALKMVRIEYLVSIPKA